MVNIKDIKITTDMLAQIAEIDEFKGSWTGFEIIQPEEDSFFDNELTHN